MRTDRGFADVPVQGYTTTQCQLEPFFKHADLTLVPSFTLPRCYTLCDVVRIHEGVERVDRTFVNNVVVGIRNRDPYGLCAVRASDAMADGAVAHRVVLDDMNLYKNYFNFYTRAPLL